jgi:membrane protease YdiL (CAAX protease family)
LQACVHHENGGTGFFVMGASKYGETFFPAKRMWRKKAAYKSLMSILRLILYPGTPRVFGQCRKGRRQFLGMPLWNEIMKSKPDSRAEMGRTGLKRLYLLYDMWFWIALLSGLAACWLLALLLGRSGAWVLTWEPWRLLLWLVLLYPVIEEWLFRGMVQPWLLTWRYGRVACCGISMANVATTLLFAGLHLFSHAPAWAALVVVPSLIYGGFRDRYHSILPGVLLHCGYNLGYFALFGLPPS